MIRSCLCGVGLLMGNGQQFLSKCLQAYKYNHSAHTARNEENKQSFGN